MEKRLLFFGLFLFIGVLVGNSALAQMYFISSNSANNFQRLNVGASPTLTMLPAWTRPTGAGDAPNMIAIGDFVYVQQVNSTANLLKFKISDNAWQPNTTITGGTSRRMYTDGTNLFQQDAALSGVKVFNFATNAFTAISTLNFAYANMTSGSGVLYYIRTVSSVTKLWKYTHSTGTITDLGALPSGTGTAYMCADANKVYLTDGDSNSPVSVYTIASGTWSTSKTLNNLMQNGFGSDGTYLYARSVTTVWQFTISNPTGNWTQLPTSAIAGGGVAAMDGAYFVPAAPVCATPVISASATQSTCTSGVANNNGTLTLTTFNSNAAKVGYSSGSSYTGPSFASATSITGTSNFTVTNSLPNPATDQAYTIRVYCDETTYKDTTVTLAPKQCAIADLSLSVAAPTSKTGAQGEQLTYTVTLTNAGPATATNVVVAVPMPEPAASLLTVSPASGTYNTTTKQWTVPSLAVGNTTLTFTLKVN